MIRKITKSSVVSWLISALISFYVNLIFSFSRIELRFSERSLNLLNEDKQVFFCFWHGRILLFPHLFRKIKNFSVVISASKDGQMLARIIERYGHSAIRGSSAKNSVQAMKALINNIRSGKNIAITPDGPKGPRFKIKGGTVDLAKKFGMPIIPICFSATKAKVLRTWDRFILPIPFFSKVVIEIGEPLEPESTSAEVLENQMNQLMQNLDKKTKIIVDY